MDWPSRLVERSPDMAVVLDADFVPVWVSPSANLLFGFAEGELRVSSLGPYVNPSDLGGLTEALLLARGQPGDCVPVAFRASNNERSAWIDCQGWMTDLGSAAEHALLIRFRRQTEASAEPAAAERDPFLSLTENSSSGFALIGPFGGIGYRNPAFGGWFPASTMTRVSDLAAVVTPATRPAFESWVAKLAEGRPEPVAIALDHVDHVQWLRCDAAPLHPDNSQGMAVGLIIHDISREVNSETRLSAMGHNMPDLAMIVDSDGRRSFVSDSVEVLLGWTPEEWSELDDASSIHPDDLAAAHRAFDTRRSDPGARSRVEMRFCRRDGSWRWFEVGTVNLGDEPAIRGMLLFARDIAERKTQDRRLRFEATHDPLSNLLNRSAVIDELETALTEARQDGSSVGALFCDLDNFKMVNDGLGHEVGDHLLQRISRRMQDAVRSGDVVGRLGGDEFLIVARSVGDEANLVALADRVAGAVADDLRGTPFPVSLSIGAAVAPAGRSTAGALVRDADAAMYRSKSSGKARTEVFRTDMRDRSERRLEVGRLLRNALDDNWVTVHYQPVFTRVDGRWTLQALETLARCPLPDGTYLSPEEFIPVAEQTGIISRLGERVRRLAAQDLVRWSGQHGDRFEVWVNMSVQELDHQDLPGRFMDRLGELGVDPDRFGIEITESAMASGHPIAMATVAGLRSAGVTVIIDDFGTGYSSLSAIKNYPADVVKVDRGFISGVLDHPADLAIVRSVVEIGAVIGLEIVAEGVETPDQLRALSAIGCASVQGFHLARPVPASAVDEHIEGWLRGDLGAGVEV